MKRLIPAIVILLCSASAAWAAPPVPLTTLSAIRALSNDEATKGLPVAFEATVTYYRSYEDTLFVQDGDAASYVWTDTSLKLAPGDRVLITGKTSAGFRPSVVAAKIQFLRSGAVPVPRPATFDELIHGQLDCLRATVHAVVRAADLDEESSLRNPGAPLTTSIRLQLFTTSGAIEAVVDSSDPSAPASLLGAEVEVTGVAGGVFDGKMQMTGVVLHVSSLADVKVLKSAVVNPWSLPVTPMDQILASYRVNDLTKRVRVHGTITYYEPGRAVVLQKGSKSLWISTQLTSADMRINDGADATGFPDAHSGFLTLDNGEIQDIGHSENVFPQLETWKELASSKSLYNLVSIEGQLVTSVREATQDEYVLTADGRLFTAIYHHPAAITLLRVPPMKQIPAGSQVRVTGICILEDSNPFNGEVPFDILLRSFDDVTVVARPSLLNTHNLIIALSLTLLLVVVVGSWGWVLRVKVRRQTGKLAAMAQFEKRRSRILEDINGSRPLTEILEEIAAMASFLLQGAPCWCEVADGAQFGNFPPDKDRMRVVHEAILARTGPPLGRLSAAFEREAPPIANQNEVLSTGSRLATLAMETRRLYTDLRRRSEFDLLTDIHNRFSLEKRLEAQIEEARQNSRIFGLIYIDLNEFKLVNDRYGHRIGDLYLQEVARRMKQQLRPQDMLARLGGDEFAVLLPVVRDRASVEEIALRLEHSYDKPLVFEGLALQGSASFGVAVYPENGVTKDSLLSAADALMYQAKNTRKHPAIADAISTEPVFENRK